MGLIPMANKELANQWKHGCMHGMYAWNDLGTPTPVSSTALIGATCRHSDELLTLTF